LLAYESSTEVPHPGETLVGEEAAIAELHVSFRGDLLEIGYNIYIQFKTV